jgi:uncharacterized protein (DUF433 family)
VRSWFKWRSDRRGRGPFLKSDHHAVGGDFAVSFLDLIDAYVAEFFREKEVKPKTIRRAYEILQGELKTQHPFAHADLCASDGRIIVRTATATKSPELIDVVSRQKWFAEIQGWTRHIHYSPATKLATRWDIATGVMIDPQIGFGKPVVQSTGITTFVLANQYNANRKDASLVADLYGVTEQNVLDAVRFESSRGSLQAA